jgi:DNA ligase (NAD+)
VTTEKARIRIKELTNQINQHNFNYYVVSKPAISDFDFDMLLEELISIENDFPELTEPDSPSKRVGGEVTKEFRQVIHKYPMLSLGNTYSEEEVKDFTERVRKLIGDDVEYVCELKFDGVAIGLTYHKGLLVQAVTRGDGVQGDDVTTNVKTITFRFVYTDRDFLKILRSAERSLCPVPVLIKSTGQGGRRTKSSLPIPVILLQGALNSWIQKR